MNPNIKYALLTWLNQSAGKLTHCISRISLKTAPSNNRMLDPAGEVTVVLNIWKRSTIEEQLEALFGQTLKPYEIWLVQCGAYVSLKTIRKRYPFLQFLNSTVNLKYFGRFALAQFITSKYVYLLDDDVIPSQNWLSVCKELSEQKNAIVAGAGRIIPKNDLYPEKMSNVPHYFIADVHPNVPFNYCEKDTLVDFGCNSWFFKTEWLKNFWRIPPRTLETGEDIHLSASCKICADIATIVPAQPDETRNGNLKKAYGRDSFASWTAPGFLDKRAQVLHNLIQGHGWQPLLWQ